MPAVDQEDKKEVDPTQPPLSARTIVVQTGAPPQPPRLSGNSGDSVRFIPPGTSLGSTLRTTGAPPPATPHVQNKPPPSPEQKAAVSPILLAILADPQGKTAIRSILLDCLGDADGKIEIVRALDPILKQAFDDAVQENKLATKREVTALEAKFKKDLDDAKQAMQQDFTTTAAALRKEFDDKLTALMPLIVNPTKAPETPTKTEATKPETESDTSKLDKHKLALLHVLELAGKDPDQLKKMQDSLGITAILEQLITLQTRPQPTSARPQTASPHSDDTIQRLNDQEGKLTATFAVVLTLAMEMGIKSAMEACLKMVENQLQDLAPTHDHLKDQVAQAQVVLEKVEANEVEDKKPAYVNRMFDAQPVDTTTADQRWDALNAGYAEARADYMTKMKEAQTALTAAKARLEASEANSGILVLYELRDELKGNLLPHTSPPVTETTN